MSKKTPDLSGRPRNVGRSSLSSRLETVRYLNEIRSSRFPVQAIAGALAAEGYTSLDKQAKALGLHRATAWTIIKNKHKLGRLSAKTIQRILSNSETPQAVREIIRKYMAERSTADRRADTETKTSYRPFPSN
jgi:hypothetical protein